MISFIFSAPTPQNGQTHSLNVFDQFVGLVIEGFKSYFVDKEKFRKYGIFSPGKSLSILGDDFSNNLAEVD